MSCILALILLGVTSYTIHSYIHNTLGLYIRMRVWYARRVIYDIWRSYIFLKMFITVSEKFVNTYTNTYSHTYIYFMSIPTQSQIYSHITTNVCLNVYFLFQFAHSAISSKHLHHYQPSTSTEYNNKTKNSNIINNKNNNNNNSTPQIKKKYIKCWKLLQMQYSWYVYHETIRIVINIRAKIFLKTLSLNLSSTISQLITDLQVFCLFALQI